MTHYAGYSRTLNPVESARMSRSELDNEYHGFGAGAGTGAALGASLVEYLDLAADDATDR